MTLTPHSPPKQCLIIPRIFTRRLVLGGGRACVCSGGKIRWFGRFQGAIATCLLLVNDMFTALCGPVGFENVCHCVVSCGSSASAYCDQRWECSRQFGTQEPVWPYTNIHTHTIYGWLVVNCILLGYFGHIALPKFYKNYECESCDILRLMSMLYWDICASNVNFSATNLSSC